MGRRTPRAGGGQCNPQAPLKKAEGETASKKAKVCVRTEKSKEEGRKQGEKGGVGQIRNEGRCSRILVPNSELGLWQLPSWEPVCLMGNSCCLDQENGWKLWIARPACDRTGPFKVIPVARSIWDSIGFSQQVVVGILGIFR
ncbi:unnamed protein product [Calypogeia fissa]